MTNIKLCGLSRIEDIEAVNELKPEYIGFIFAQKSRRYVSFELARTLRGRLDPSIKAVGVFVNESIENITALLEDGTIQMAQLHGKEDEDYIETLRAKTDCPISKAWRVDTKEDVEKALVCSADYILLDSGEGGTGTTFDWSLLDDIERPYFLAGGLDPENVAGAVKGLRPYAVDVSSGIETDGYKDPAKMKRFVQAVRRVAEIG